MRQLDATTAQYDGLKINSGLFNLSGDRRRSPNVWDNQQPRQQLLSPNDSIGLTNECREDEGNADDLCANLLAAWG